MKNVTRRIPLRQFRGLLPPYLLEQMAVDYKIDSDNSIKLSGPLVFSTILHGLLYDSKVSLRCMADKFAEHTGIDLHHSTLGKRLALLPTDYFEEIFTFLYAKVNDKINPRSPGLMSVHLVDATTVTLSAKWICFGLKVKTCSPNKARTHVKAVFELHNQMPKLMHLCSEASENNDSVALGETIHANCQAGELYVFDKGCHGRDRLLKIHEKGAYFLTPHSSQNLAVHRVIWTADPETLPVLAPGPDDPDFVVVRVEECRFENADRYSSKKYASMPLAVVHGLRYDRRAQKWKSLVLMTNLPFSEDGSRIGPYSYLELARVYRDRWQIETFFKKIKGNLSYDHLLSRNENGIKIMIYMCLIAALLMIWFKAVTQNKNGWPSVKFWLEVSCRDWIEELICGQSHLRRFQSGGT